MWRHLIEAQAHQLEAVRLLYFGFGWLFDLDLHSGVHIPAWKLSA